MKQNLSKEEYLELGRKIKSMRDSYWAVFKMMIGHFPKNSKAIKSLLKTDETLMSLYFDVEMEFLRDYPAAEVTEFGR